MGLVIRVPRIKLWGTVPLAVAVPVDLRPVLLLEQGSDVRGL